MAHKKPDSVLTKSVWFMLGLLIGVIIATGILRPFEPGDVTKDMILGGLLIPGACPVDIEFDHAMQDFQLQLKNNPGTISVDLTNMLRLMEPNSVMMVQGDRGLQSMKVYYERCTNSKWGEEAHEQ